MEIECTERGEAFREEEHRVAGLAFHLIQSSRWVVCAPHEGEQGLFGDVLGIG